MALVLMCALVVPASAQPKPKKDGKAEPAAASGKDKEGAGAGAKKDGGKKDGVKNFDFTDFNLSGKMRTPQLLYFLERANEELERASLEKRSFIPHMVRTVEEEAL